VVELPECATLSWTDYSSGSISFQHSSASCGC